MDDTELQWCAYGVREGVWQMLSAWPIGQRYHNAAVKAARELADDLGYRELTLVMLPEPAPGVIWDRPEETFPDYSGQLQLAI